MESWDIERAQRAAISLARSRNTAEVFASLWQYGARDYRNIGHKAIFVANAERTLRVVGWQHAEPVLRSLTYALLKHDGQNPSKNDLDPDRPSVIGASPVFPRPSRLRRR